MWWLYDQGVLLELNWNIIVIVIGYLDGNRCHVSSKKYYKILNVLDFFAATPQICGIHVYSLD